MSVPHGVVRCPDGTYEFYWLGNQLSLEDFNKQTLHVAQQLFEEMKGVAMGMDLSSSINEGKITVAKIEAIEEILRLPLCEACKKLIGG